MQIAETIYNQINGNKLQLMVGAKDFVGSENALTFGFKGCRKANKVRITLNGKDLYNVEFFKLNMRKMSCDTVAEIEDLYFDQLLDYFESVTGLYTSL